MDAVKSLAAAKTIILIAHRLTTVRNCELVFLLERGRITASGTYEELIDKSQHFRALAAAATN
jgi:ABC-type multidrug transport system fused ATPase/permease subunit